MFEREEKDALRREMKLRRAGMKNAASDKEIARAALRAFGGYERFFVYLSFGTEADTSRLVFELLTAGKTVLVPRIEGGKMSAVPYTAALSRSPLGFLQPAEGTDTPCDVCFTPLLAADRLGSRLGYGGGFYDGYFSAHPQVLRVGLCYEGQVLKRVPHGEKDVPLQALVTELGAIALDSGR